MRASMSPEVANHPAEACKEDRHTRRVQGDCHCNKCGDSARTRRIVTDRERAKRHHERYSNDTEGESQDDTYIPSAHAPAASRGDVGRGRQWEQQPERDTQTNEASYQRDSSNPR